jgi:hypothetical protein
MDVSHVSLHRTLTNRGFPFECSFASLNIWMYVSPISICVHTDTQVGGTRTKGCKFSGSRGCNSIRNQFSSSQITDAMRRFVTHILHLMPYLFYAWSCLQCCLCLVEDHAASAPMTSNSRRSCATTIFHKVFGFDNSNEFPNVTSHLERIFRDYTAFSEI